MKFPNKVNRYKTTVLYHMSIILDEFSNGDSATKLYEKISKMINIEDFVAAVSCLYAIGKIDIENGGVICLKK